MSSPSNELRCATCEALIRRDAGAAALLKERATLCGLAALTEAQDDRLAELDVALADLEPLGLSVWEREKRRIIRQAAELLRAP